MLGTKLRKTLRPERMSPSERYSQWPGSFDSRRTGYPRRGEPTLRKQAAPPLTVKPRRTAYAAIKPIESLTRNNANVTIAAIEAEPSMTSAYGKRSHSAPVMICAGTAAAFMVARMTLPLNDVENDEMYVGRYTSSGE